MLNKHAASEYFGSEIINADLGTILAAMEELTKIEFRMWIEHCKTCQNAHWSHFRGMETHFLRMGNWELPDLDQSVDLSETESDESATGDE